MEINLNTRVTVILTEHGKNVLDKHRKNLEKNGNTDLKSLFSCDENGKFTIELWDLMYIFGKSMYMGSEQVFLHNKIYNLRKSKNV